MTTNKSKVSLFSKVNLRIVAIILSCILVQSVAVGSVIAVKSEPIADQYGSATRTAYPAIELQWKPSKPVAGEDVTFSILFKDAASGGAKSHVDYTFTISKEGKVVYTTSKHTHSGTDTINQKLDAGMYSVVITITGIDFNKVEPKSSEFSVNVEKQTMQEQPTPVAPSPAVTRAEVMLAISTLSDSYAPNAIVSAKVVIQGGKAGDAAVAKIWSPDGKAVSSVNIIIAEEKFEASLSIGSVPSDAAAGTWKVTLEYAGKVASSAFKVIGKSEVATKPVTSLEIKTEKDAYSIGETARAKGVIKGIGGSGTGGSKIMIVITGPDGKVYARNEIEPARDGSFEFSFDIKRGYPTGTWNVNARETTTGLDVDYLFKVTEPIGGEAGKQKLCPPKCPEIGFFDSNGQSITTVKGGKSNSDNRMSNETNGILKCQGFDPESELTILVLDPDENVYLQDEVRTSSDGTCTHPIKLDSSALEKTGTWSIQVVTGDSIEELTFVVKEISGIESQTEISAVVKNLKKMTLISVKNTGTEDIWAVSIKVKQGSIQFVKVISKELKDWDRIRIASGEVVVGPQGLAVSDEGVPNDKGVKNKRTLQPSENMIIIMKWNDRPEIAGSMKVGFGETGNSPLELVVNDTSMPNDPKK